MPGQTVWQRAHVCLVRLLKKPLLEVDGVQAMLGQQFVKLGPVALGNTSGMRHVADGGLQKSDQVVPLKFPARIIKRGKAIFITFTDARRC